MDELASSSTHLPRRQEPQTHCSYCGAPLDPAYYFCLRCATPYQSVESVLPPLHVAAPTAGVLIEKKAPHVWPLFWTYVAVAVATAVVCLFAFGEGRSGLRLLLQSVVLFVTTCVFAVIHWRSLAVQLKRTGLLHPVAWLGLLALAPLLAVNYVYHGFLLELLGDDVRLPTQELRESGIDEASLIFLICVLPAVLEEIAFRGLVQHWLHVAIRPVTAMVLASALFTAMHASILSAPYLFAVGMLLAVVNWKTRSLYPCILIHFLHNFVVLVYLWR